MPIPVVDTAYPCARLLVMSKVVFPIRTDDQLRTASNRVYYCADQVLGLAAAMRRSQDGGTELTNHRVGNAALESLTIHARALISFFDDEPRFPDDVSVRHFFQSAPSPWTPPPWSFVVDKYIKTRVGKETVHITYPSLVDPNAERKVGADRGEAWYFGAIATAFEERVAAFYEQVPRHLLGERWATPLGV
jgi:hypothetical protein